MFGKVLVIAAVITAQPLVNEDVLEPSVRNEVCHALSLAPTNAPAAALTARLVGTSRIGSIAASLVVASLLLMFGEFLPKLFCSARPLRRMLALAPYWAVFARVFVPVGSLVQRLIEHLMPRQEAKPKMTPEAVLKILEDRKDGVRLSDLESALIGRIMVLRAKGEFVVPETLLPALDDKV